MGAITGFGPLEVGKTFDGAWPWKAPIVTASASRVLVSDAAVFTIADRRTAREAPASLDSLKICAVKKRDLFRPHSENRIEPQRPNSASSSFSRGVDAPPDTIVIEPWSLMGLVGPARARARSSAPGPSSREAGARLVSSLARRLDEMRREGAGPS